jgi:hypothetical protein
MRPLMCWSPQPLVVMLALLALSTAWFCTKAPNLSQREYNHQLLHRQGLHPT